MKKLFVFTLYFVLFLVSANLTSTSADSKATALGFDVDDQIYGGYVDYDEELIVVYYGSKIVGTGELHTALYRDQTDSDYGLIIYQTINKPQRVRIDFFNYFSSQTSYINVYSDVDGSSEIYGYGYYASSADFDMIQPQPQEIADESSYSIGVQYDGNWSVSGSVTIEESELSIDTNHSSYNDIFNAKYKFSCINAYTDCSYRKAETYQIGMFLIDWSDNPPTSHKRFINEITMYVQYVDGNSNPLTVFWTLSPKGGGATTKTYFWG